MNFKKTSLIFLTYIFLFFFTISFAYSACNLTPTFTQIYSGSNYLGDFVNSNKIYVKPNLETDPIKFIINFENTQNNCFSDASQVSMKLFQSSGLIIADNLKTNSYNNGTLFITKATFTFSIPNFLITGPFTSSYFINSNNNIKTGSFNFYIDTTPPDLTLTQDITKTIYNTNDIININYVVSDLESKLDSILISGFGFNKIINLNKSKSDFSSIKLNLSGSGTKNLIFTVKDKLSNQIQKNLTFFVDSTAPQIINNLNGVQFDKVYNSLNGVHRISFNNIIVSDESFLHNGNIKLFGDFSSFNPEASSQIANCYKQNDGNYNCNFDNIKITTSSSSNQKIIFTLIDDALNKKDFFYNTEIFVDTSGPKVLDFYLKNKLKNKNIVSIYDNSTYVYLKFYDDTIKKDNNPKITIIPNFDLLQFPNLLLNSTSCTLDKNSGTGECIWKIGTDLSIFTDAKQNSSTFFVKLYDKYLNIGDSSFTFKIDNDLPIIEKIELVKNSGIQDGYIKSSDLINFRIYVKDKNLEVNNNFFVKADFTSISDKNGYDIRNGICSLYNSTTYRCDFNSITTRIGYRNETINFSVTDIAGNTQNVPFNVEIFKRSNEPQNDIYQVIDMNNVNLYNPNYLQILNPINRNNIISDSSIAWFEGNITLKTPTDNYKIVNYGLKGCDFKNNPSFLLGDVSLYPNSNIIYKNPGDEKFALKIQIQRQSNPSGNDLNDFDMQCILSVLKRDDTTVYAPEFVNFTAKIGFYDLPRGNLLKADATKINELIGEANFVGSWFDKVYKYYNMLKGACTVVNSGGTILKTITGGLDALQAILNAGIVTQPAAITVGNLRKSTEDLGNSLVSILGGETGPDNFITKACNYVTCKNGGLTDILGVKDFFDGIQNSIGNKLCSQSGTKSKTTKSKS